MCQNVVELVLNVCGIGHIHLPLIKTQQYN